MAISYDTLKNWIFEDNLSTYSRQDCILYALSLGYGADPLDFSELPFVYEQNQRVVPSIFTVLGAPGAWAANPATGIDWMKILHGEHRMTLHGTAAPQGVLRSKTSLTRLIDKGAGKGALVVTERRIHDEADGRLLATVEHTSFCRADGGFGRSDEPMNPLPATPQTPPDLELALPTLPRAALLYRLNGDHNPIHADPVAARSVGFQAPLLHGLCTYGMAGKAVLKGFADNQPERLKSLAVRFSAPFFPGETLAVEMWCQGATVNFRARSVERNIAVLTHGVATLAH